MKRLPGLIIVAALAVIVVWSIASGQAHEFLGLSQSGHGAGTASEPGLQAVPAERLAMTVAHVHDGDTLFLTAADGTEEKVRLIGVDTPELQPVEDCFAAAARDYLRQLVPDGSTVTVTADAEGQDQYGRSLYYLWTADDVFVNLKLVTDGYGTALRIEPHSAHWDELIAAENAARAAAAGMWAQC